MSNQDEVNPNFVEEVVTLFFRDSSRLLNNIDQALEKCPNDFRKLDTYMHQLQGEETVEIRNKRNEVPESTKESEIGNGLPASSTTYIGDEIGDETNSSTNRLVTRSTTKSELRSETMRSENGEEISDEFSDEIDEFRPWRSPRANEEGDILERGDDLRERERERGIFGKAVRKNKT
ncbi:uncharacterized protein A4U43_C06F14010 [Asparagus officinalis]|uniref:Histidine-containing phosphotransfer protein n=1 Tax=Asparagus officinalis TaxID=4686 RepID=A0A5P1EQ83_ASPOF|nr:uncharacterized protein A4U43_C06F14010 [Asparagus officinalis]